MIEKFIAASFGAACIALILGSAFGFTGAKQKKESPLEEKVKVLKDAGYNTITIEVHENGKTIIYGDRENKYAD